MCFGVILLNSRTNGTSKIIHTTLLLFSDQDRNAGDEKPLVRLIKQERAYLTFTRVTKGIHHKLPQVMHLECYFSKYELISFIHSV